MFSKDLEIGIGDACRELTPKHIVAFTSAQIKTLQILVKRLPTHSTAIASPISICIRTGTANESNTKTNHEAEENLPSTTLMPSQSCLYERIFIFSRQITNVLTQANRRTSLTILVSTKTRGPRY